MSIVKLQLPVPENKILETEYTALFTFKSDIYIYDPVCISEAISRVEYDTRDLSPLTCGQIKTFFLYILNGKFRLSMINGRDLCMYQNTCDFCDEELEGKYHYYCSNLYCKLTGCKDCIIMHCNNTGHDDDIHKRRACNNEYIISCDMCNQIVIDRYYSNSMDCNDSSFDICSRCYDEDPNENIDKVPYKLYLEIPFKDCGVDDLFDWVPILTDSSFNFLLVNRNTDQYAVYSRFTCSITEIPLRILNQYLILNKNTKGILVKATNPAFISLNSI